MHGDSSGGGPAWQQQQSMHHQNQFGGGHPGARMMAVLQEQQRQHYQQQQQGQGMWNPGVNHLFSGVDHNMRTGNFMMQQYRFFGRGRCGMYHPQQQQQRFERDSNANPNAPQRPGWVEPHPGRTPCKDWWSHVVSEMRVVDSPRGLDLDVEDKHANVMEELRKEGSKAGTGIDEEAKMVSSGFPDVFQSPNGAGEALRLTPPAVVTGGCPQKSAEVAWRVESPHQLYALQQRQQRQAQTSALSRGSGVSPTREQQQQRPSDTVVHPQHHLCNASDYSASKYVGNSQFAKGTGPKAAANSSPEGGSPCDGHAIAQSLYRQVLDDAEGEQGEKAASKQCHSSEPRSINSKDRVGGLSGMPSMLRKVQSENEAHAEGEQQEQGKAVLRSVNTPYDESRERQRLPKPSRAAQKLPRPGNSLSYRGIPDVVDEGDSRDVGWDNASDQYSGSDGSDGNPSSGSDTDDSDGSGSDDEAEYSAIQRSSQSGMAGQSTLEYSAFHNAPVAHARNSIVSSANHAAGHHNTGSLLGEGKGGHPLHLEASVSNAPIDVPLITALGRPQKAASANAIPCDDVVSSFPLGLDEAHAMTANAVIAASGSVAAPGNSMTTAAGMEDSDRIGDEVGTLAIAKAVPQQASCVAPVSAAGGALSRRISTIPTATKALLTAAGKRNEDASTLPRQVAGVQKSLSLSAGTPGGRSGANEANAASKAAVTQFPRVCRGNERKRLKSGDPATKRASRDLDSSQVASPTHKSESPFFESLDFQRTAAVTTDKRERAAQPATGATLVTATSAGTTSTVTTSTPTALTARRLPIIRSRQHVPRVPLKTPGSAQVSKSQRKRSSPFHRMRSPVQHTPGVTPLRVDKAKAAVTVVKSQSSTKSCPPLSVTASTVSPHVETDSSPSTNADGATSAATAAAAVTELKPAAHSSSRSPASGVPVGAAALTLPVTAPPRPIATGKTAPAGPSSLTATETVASTVPSDCALSTIRSSGNRLHRTAAPSLSNNLSATSKPRSRSIPKAASPVVSHHRPQPQPPSAGSLKEKSIAAKDALRTEGGAVLARATPPSKTAGSASESSVADRAPKRLSIVLLSDPPPAKPTGALAAATASSATRNAAAAVTARLSSIVEDTGIPISAVKGTPTPSGVKTPFTMANSTGAKPTASGTRRVVVASASGNALECSTPASPEMRKATGSLTSGMSTPLSTLGLATKSTTTTAVAAAPPVIAVPPSQASGDDGGKWSEDPYGCYGYIERDLTSADNYYPAKSSPTKALAGDRPLHRYSMVGSLALSPLSTSSSIGKTDAASSACAGPRQSNEPDVLQEMGYMYY